MCEVFECHNSHILCFIVMFLELFKYWRLPNIVGVHNIVWEGYNTLQPMGGSMTGRG